VHHKQLLFSLFSFFISPFSDVTDYDRPCEMVDHVVNPESNKKAFGRVTLSHRPSPILKKLSPLVKDFVNRSKNPINQSKMLLWLNPVCPYARNDPAGLPLRSHQFQVNLAMVLSIHLPFLLSILTLFLFIFLTAPGHQNCVVQSRIPLSIFLNFALFLDVSAPPGDSDGFDGTLRALPRKCLFICST
jgi:hypothetical protein